MGINRFLRNLIIAILILLLFCTGLVVFFDPFYHYHKPVLGLKAVLNEKEYQVPGTLDHFDYDAMIVGSSVAENNNNRWFDAAFGCKSIKAIRSYGATADLCYFIERGFKNQNLKYVFLNLDPSSLTTGVNTTFEETGSPMYLYDKNPINDVKYIFNKDVIFEKIPYMLASSLTGDYDEGESYNWAKWKAFDEETCLFHYIQEPEIKPMMEDEAYEDIAKQNIDKILSIVKTHPETEFYIFIPPYSALWWDMSYRSGETNAYLYVEELAFRTLLQEENVRVYNFQNAKDVIFDLNHYTDSLHFDPGINNYICDCLKDGTYEIHNEEELKASMEAVHEYADTICDYIKDTYGDRIKVAVY